MIDPYRVIDGKLVPDYAASRAYARELETRERAQAARAARPFIASTLADLCGRMADNLKGRP
jgi:hypothetical protein